MWPDGWVAGTSEETKVQDLIGVKFNKVHPDIAEQLLRVREDEELDRHLSYGVVVAVILRA